MDKVEYRIRADEIKALIGEGSFAEAVKVADTIDWKRVKSVSMLCTISDLYKINRRFQESKDVLLMAYDRHPTGRAIVFSLCELSIKMGEFVQAVEYYKEFVRIAPRDTGRYILQYKLYEAQEVSLEERIAVLEEFKKHDYRERWAYELAYLYHRVGLTTECIEECDEIFLWFGEGRYVMKALELKNLHEPLSPEQQDRYIKYKQAHGGIVDKSIVSEKDEVGKDDARTVEIKQPTKEMPSVNGDASQAPRKEPVPVPENELGATREFRPGDMPLQPAAVQPPEDTRVITKAPVRDPEEIVYPHISEIKEPSVDVSTYNTINLQESLARSLREVIGDGTASGAQPEAAAATDTVVDGQAVQPVTEEIFDESDLPPEEDTGYIGSDASYPSQATGALPDQYVSDETGTMPNRYVSDETGTMPNQYVSDETGAMQTRYVSDETGTMSNQYVSDETGAMQTRYVSDETGTMPNQYVSDETGALPDQYVSDDTGTLPDQYVSDETGSIPAQYVSDETGEMPYRYVSDDTGAMQTRYVSDDTGTLPDQYVSDETGDMSDYVPEQTGPIYGPDEEYEEDYDPDSSYDPVVSETAELYGNADGQEYEGYDAEYTVKEYTGDAYQRDPDDGYVSGEYMEDEEPDDMDEVSEPEAIEDSITSEIPTEGMQEIFFDTKPQMGIEIKYGGNGPILGEEKVIKPMQELPIMVSEPSGVIPEAPEPEPNPVIQPFRRFDYDERPLEDEVPGAVIHPNANYQMHNHFESMLSQDDDGQISMAVEPEPEVEKQITGQISIAEYLANWEQFKKEQQQKQFEQVKKRVADETGDMFSEFDEKTKAGLQEKIEKAISDAIRKETYARSSGRGDWSRRKEDVINSAVDEVISQNTAEMEAVELSEDDGYYGDDSVGQETGSLPYTEERYQDEFAAYQDDQPYDSDREYDEQAYETEEGSYDDGTTGYADEDGYTAGDESEEDAANDNFAEDYTETDNIATEEKIAEENSAEENPVEENAAEEAVVADEQPAVQENADLEAGSQEQSDSAETAKAQAPTGMVELTSPAAEEETQAPQSEPDAEKEPEAEAESAPGEYTSDMSEAFEKTEDAEAPKTSEAADEDDDDEDDDSSKESVAADAQPDNPAEEGTPQAKVAAAEAQKKRHIGNRELEERVRSMTPEEKELFGPYIHHKKSRRQIINAIDNLSMDAFSGNAIVTGEEGAGTVNLAKGLIKAMQATDHNFSGKVAKITANTLNKKSTASIFDKLADGALIIQRAADLEDETVGELIKILQSYTKGLVLVMEDTREDMDRFLDKNPSLKPSFNVRVDIEALDDDSLVAYARQYALEKEYAIDNLGILALHTRISERQTLDHDVTVSEVKDIVDDAIYYAEKRSFGHFVDVLVNKRYDENDMIILREKDFMH